MSSKSTLIIVALAAAAALLLAACGGSGDSEAESASSDSSDEVATLEAETATAEVASAELTEEDLLELWDAAVLEFSACVREEGITDFPDLDAGRILDTDSFFREVTSAGVELTDPAVVEAMFNCQDALNEVVSLLPPPNADDTQAVEEAALAIMACIRDNGYPDVPDLDLSGGFDANVLIQLVPFVDVTDPAFLNVAGTCVAESPVDFDGRDSIAELLQS